MHYGKASKKSKGKSRPSGSSGSSSGGGGSRVNAGNPVKPHGKSRKVHYQMPSVGDVEKADTKRDNLAKLWKPSVETVEQRGTMRRCV